jgi:hypothetical protein
MVYVQSGVVCACGGTREDSNSLVSIPCWYYLDRWLSSLPTALRQG